MAVKIQEGIALALDPSIEIWRVAMPILFESERRRGIVQRQMKKFMNNSNNWFQKKGGGDDQNSATKL